MDSESPLQQGLPQSHPDQRESSPPGMLASRSGEVACGGRARSFASFACFLRSCSTSPLAPCHLSTHASALFLPTPLAEMNSLYTPKPTFNLPLASEADGYDDDSSPTQNVGAPSSQKDPNPSASTSPPLPSVEVSLFSSAMSLPPPLSAASSVSTPSASPATSESGRVSFPATTATAAASINGHASSKTTAGPSPAVAGESSSSRDPPAEGQLIDALSGKDRLVVLRCAEEMEALIKDPRCVLVASFVAFARQVVFARDATSSLPRLSRTNVLSSSSGALLGVLPPKSWLGRAASELGRVRRQQPSTRAGDEEATSRAATNVNPNARPLRPSLHPF